MDKIIQNILESSHSINPLDSMVLESTSTVSVMEEVSKNRAKVIANIPTNTDYYPSDNIDYPYFTSCEIIANKAPFKDTPDSYYVMAVGMNYSYKEWFEDIDLAGKGIITERYIEHVNEWKNTVYMQSTMYLSTYQYPTSKKDLRESLISLGWNPDIPFTEENRVKANKRFMEVNRANFYEVVDLSAPLLDESEIVIEVNKKNKLYPLYIILVEGNSVFSHLTKAVTNGPFSHAAISLDEKLDKMYSFNMNNQVNTGGGFSIEDVKNYPQENKLGVFAIFVKDKDIHTIKNMLDYYKSNTSKTTYSMFNILLLPLQKAFKMDMSMICSEFVDSLLKFCNININDKESPLVVPMDFYRASETNKKIYKLYEDQVKKYKPDSIKRKIDKLLSTYTASYVNESLVLEVKDIPVQFSNNGDLLIKNMNNLNYEEEYNRIHKILLLYDKSDNIEGMKYELAELWFLNHLLERDIYNKKNEIANSKCRARVLNDFNKYMDKVLKEDPKFNFSKYYDNTQFSNNTIRIKGSTIKYTIDYVKHALKPTV